MAPGKPQLKFERNMCFKFRDNCDMDGRTHGGMTDGRQTMDKLRFCELCLTMSVELMKSQFVHRLSNKKTFHFLNVWHYM